MLHKKDYYVPTYNPPLVYNPDWNLELNHRYNLNNKMSFSYMPPFLSQTNCFTL